MTLCKRVSNPETAAKIVAGFCPVCHQNSVIHASDLETYVGKVRSSTSAVFECQNDNCRARFRIGKAGTKNK